MCDIITSEVYRGFYIGPASVDGATWFRFFNPLINTQQAFPNMATAKKAVDTIISTQTLETYRGVKILSDACGVYIFHGIYGKYYTLSIEVAREDIDKWLNG